MNLKHLKTRIIGIALTLSMLSGGVVVSADGPNVTAALSYGQTVHVSLAAGERGKFYSFTPETSGYYYFYSTNQRGGDPYLQVYDSSMQLIATANDTTDYSDFSLAYDCTAGQTYYLYAMEYDTPDAVEYDLGVGWGATGTATGDVASIVPVWGNFYRVGVRSDSYQLVVNPFSCDDTEFTVYWYDEDGHEVGTGNTYTPDHFGNYDCIVRGPDRSVMFWFTVFHDYELRFDNDSMFEYMLVDKDTDILIDPAFTIADQTVEVHSQRWSVFPYFDANSNRSAEIIEQDPHGFLFSGGIHDFSSFWFQDYIPNGSYNEKAKYITVFVMDGETDGVLVPDEPVHIETDNNGEWNDIINKKEDYTYQQIYSFTSPSDGTATFEITDIVKGAPCIVIFDSGYNMIGCVNAAELLYSYGNRVYPGFDTSGVFPEVSLTLHLSEGETYYVAVPTVCDLLGGTDNPNRFNADFDLKVTFAEDQDPSDVPSDEPTSAPTSSPASEPTGAPASNPTNTPASVPSTPSPTIPPANNAPVRETGVAGFVERLYTIALGRASDPVGKQDWIDAITLRGETGAGCARGFLYSPEFLNKGVSNEEFVATLYRTFFDREPDQAGFNAWVAVLNNGTSKEEVIEGFINSTEWANLCLFYGIRNGGTGVPSIEIEPNQATIDFATRLYTTCLGRSADQAGLMAWARQLANQRDTGTGAARGFFFSSEFTGQNVSNGEYVTRLYRTFMNREPDQAGYDAWVSQLDSGVSREEVFDGFAQSIEFARICAQYGIVR